jgi:hypothetical protein
MAAADADTECKGDDHKMYWEKTPLPNLPLGLPAHENTKLCKSCPIDCVECERATGLCTKCMPGLSWNLETFTCTPVSQVFGCAIVDPTNPKKCSVCAGPGQLTRPADKVQTAIPMNSAGVPEISHEHQKMMIDPDFVNEMAFWKDSNGICRLGCKSAF